MEMKRLKIRYADLAKATGYGLSTVQQWMYVPLTPERESIIRQGIALIQQRRGKGERKR